MKYSFSHYSKGFLSMTHNVCSYDLCGNSKLVSLKVQER
jgi:hypothetical protein